MIEVFKRPSSSLFCTFFAIGAAILFSFSFEGKNPILSIGFSSIFLLMIGISLYSTYCNLRKSDFKVEIDYTDYSLFFVFSVGFCLQIILMSIGYFGGIDEEFRVVPEIMKVNPLLGISQMLANFGVGLKYCDWWVHLVIGLSIAVCVATVLLLFAKSDRITALNATILGPVIGSFLFIAILAGMLIVGFAAMAVAGAVMAMLRAIGGNE